MELPGRSNAVPLGRGQMPKYRVTFKFHDNIPVHNLITEYSSIGVQIGYEENMLRSIIHTYEVPEDLSHEQRLGYSDRQLRLLWELLEYRHGFPIRPSSSHTSVVEQSTVLRATVGTSIDAYICSEVVLPKETLFDGSPLRLMVWLRFLNDARNSPSDAEAIRLYYAVWEDMKGRPNQNHPIQALHLKYIRDFVSHGERLLNEDLLMFLEGELGYRTDQFDPTNPKHRGLVKHQRNQASTL